MIDSLVERLNAHLETIVADGSYNMLLPPIKQAHDQISNILDEADDKGLARELLSPENSDTTLKLTEINALLHSTTEKVLANNLLNSKMCPKEFIKTTYFNKGFPDLLKQQVGWWQNHGVKFRSGDTICIVGGGALPQTQLFLANFIDCNIISIDRDEEAAILCNEILNVNNNPRLKVTCADGIYFDYSKISLILVATLVQDKNAIAHQAFKTTEYAHFAPRNPVGAHAAWRSTTNATAIEEIGWKFVGNLSPNCSSVGSLLFNK